MRGVSPSDIDVGTSAIDVTAGEIERGRTTHGALSARPNAKTLSPS